MKQFHDIIIFVGDVNYSVKDIIIPRDGIVDLLGEPEDRNRNRSLDSTFEIGLACNISCDGQKIIADLEIFEKEYKPNMLNYFPCIWYNNSKLLGYVSLYYCQSANKIKSLGDQGNHVFRLDHPIL